MAWDAVFNHTLPLELCTEGLLSTGAPKCCRGKLGSVRVQETLVPSLDALGDTCSPLTCLSGARRAHPCLGEAAGGEGA